MHKKILRISSFLGMLIFAGIPAKSIQRFAIKEDEIYIANNGKRVPTQITSLTFRDKRYIALPNRRAKGWLEFNVAPDDEVGPKPIYGETISVRMESDHQLITYCFCLELLESGHPTVVDMPAMLQLPSNENPECVILTWSKARNRLIATMKEDKTNEYSKLLQY
jgi:hypothetical protein